MRTAIVQLCLCSFFALFGATKTTAAPIELRFSGTNGGVIEFGAAGFRASIPMFGAFFDSATIKFEIDPLRSLILTEDESLYRFPRGWFELRLEWTDEDGKVRNGSWTSTTPDFDFIIQGENPPPDLDSDYPWSKSDFFIGGGRFDAATAKYLGASRHTIGASFSWTWENIEPGPGAGPRTVFNERTTGLEIMANVPEPSAAVLFALGLAGSLRMFVRLLPKRRIGVPPLQT